MMRERKPLRIENHNYSQEGWYFITICTKNRIDWFGSVINGNMILNKIGKIAQIYWKEIPQHFPQAKLGEFIIMPNHIHGILIINNTNSVGDADLRPLQCNVRKTKTLIPKIIHGYKSSFSRTIRQFYNPDFTWQRSYYDHIIRDEQDHENIKNYIKNNPLNWSNDQEYNHL